MKGAAISFFPFWGNPHRFATTPKETSDDRPCTSGGFLPRPFSEFPPTGETGQSFWGPHSPGFARAPLFARRGPFSHFTSQTPHPGVLMPPGQPPDRPPRWQPAPGGKGGQALVTPGVGAQKGVRPPPGSDFLKGAKRGAPARFHSEGGPPINFTNAGLPDPKRGIGPHIGLPAQRGNWPFPPGPRSKTNAIPPPHRIG